jgi:flagella basal body P-ring formation protein FlgA
MRHNRGNFMAGTAKLAALYLLVVPGISRAEACVAIHGPSIAAGDLAPFLEPFRRLHPGFPVSPAPNPGLRRVLSPAMLNRILRTISPQKPFESVGEGLCVIRESRLLSAEEFAAAAKEAFPGRQVEIEVIEYSRHPVGAGRVRFAAHRLPLVRDTSAPILWNAWVIEEDGGKRQVWAKLRLRETRSVFVAAREIRAGEILSPTNTRTELRTVFPEVNPMPAGELAARLSGSAALRTLPAGRAICPPDVMEVPVIRKGESIRLEVISNHTRVAIAATAQTTAYAGRRISVSTAFSPRPMVAVAQTHGHAILNTQAPKTAASADPE